MKLLYGQVVTPCVWVLRYALIVLRADDNGQGGAFALFSLLKRQAELGKKSKVMGLQSQHIALQEHTDHMVAREQGTSSTTWRQVNLLW